MQVLTNQTLYKCDMCGKRLLSKQGAKIHEKQYCKVVREKQREELQAKCKHEKTNTHYDYIPGEAVMQPEHDYCVDCGKILHWGWRA